MTQQYCSLTGELNCKCDHPNKKVSPLLVDLKATLRKLWTDHGVYTAFVIKAVNDGVDPTVLVNRLMDNQKEIGDQLKPIIGEQKGNRLTKILQKHISLAGKIVMAFVKQDKKINDIVNQFLNNGDKVAAVMTSINPKKLPYEQTQSMFQTHNQFVINMTKERFDKNYLKEQQIYDAYYNEILEMSDAIYYALYI